MSKHKRKGSPLKSQKIALAHSRNEFVTHLKEFCDKVTANPEIFKHIPPEDLDMLYQLRFRPIRIRRAPDNKVPSAVIKYCQEMLPPLLKNTMIDFGVGNLAQVSMHDYFSTAHTLSVYARRDPEPDYAAYKEVKKALEPLTIKLESELNTEMWKKYDQMIHCTIVLYANLDTGIYAFKNDNNIVLGDVGFYTEIYGMQTEKIDIVIDDKKRPAHKVGWIGWQPPNPFMDYVSVKSEALGLLPGMKLDVYIQNHALDRLFERMDGINGGILHLAVVNSLKDIKTCRNKKGELLIEYTFFGNKTGYFRAEVTDGKLLLLTFLFLTNNGTPEGERLHTNTGIMKEDKIYLTIDKISSFIDSDIGNDPRVKKMFTDAGCQSLFKVNKWAYFAEENNNRQLSELVSNYLKLEGGNNPAIA